MMDKGSIAYEPSKGVGRSVTYEPSKGVGRNVFKLEKSIESIKVPGVTLFGGYAGFSTLYSKFNEGWKHD